MRWRNAAVFLLALGVMTSPLFLHGGSKEGGERVGTDDRAVEEVAAVRPGYAPWFSSLWTPGPDAESLLFTLQAALGAAGVGYCLGFARGRRARRDA